jgi:hypothetical protein
MRIYLVLLLLVLVSSYATAQFSNAKLILPNLDTLVGKAKLRYDTVVFRGSDGKTSYYSSKQVSSVIMNDEIYFSSDYLKISTSANSNSFFAKVLIQGDVVLYYRRNNPKDANSWPSFFIGKKESTIIELVSLEKKIYKDGLYYTQYYDAYKNQLVEFFKDCPNQIVDVKKDFFKESPMVKVVEQYSNCKNLSIRKKSISAAKPTFSLFGGVDQTHIKFSAGGAYAFKFIDNVSTSSTMPFVGLKLELPVKHSKSIKLVTEVMFKKTNVSWSAYTLPYWNTCKLSVTYVKINLGAEKSFPISNKSSLEIHAGLSLSPIIDSRFTSSDPYNQGFGRKVIEAGAWYGAGINFGRTGFFVRNENVIVNFILEPGLKMSGSYLYGGLKYKLSK